MYAQLMWEELELYTGTPERGARGGGGGGGWQAPTLPFPKGGKGGKGALLEILLV